MAIGKKSFLLYSDLLVSIEHLTNEEKGILFNHLLLYVNDKNPVLTDRLLLTAWKPIEMQLKRDLQKFEEVKEKRSEAGKASAEKRAKEREQAATNPTHVESVERCSTLSTDNDTVNVNDNVNVNDTVNDTEIKDTLTVPPKVGTSHKKNKRLFSMVKKEDYPIEQQQYFVLARGFFDVFWNHAKELNLPLKNLKEANADEWTRQIRIMIESKEATEEQIIEVGRFLKTDSFWKTNVRSVLKLREKFENIYASSKKVNNGNEQKSTLQDPEFQAMVMAKFATSPNFQGFKND